MEKESEEEKISRVLREIQSRIPPNLLKNVVRDTKVTSSLEFVVKKALQDPDFPEEKKKIYQTMLDSGEFSKTKPKENKRYAKLIDKFLELEIKKEIKAGNLPAQYERKL